MDKADLDKLKPKSITNLTGQEAKDFAIYVANEIVCRYMDEDELLHAGYSKIVEGGRIRFLPNNEYFDGQWTDTAKEKMPIHTDFVGTVKKMLSEVLSDEEIEILFRMGEVSSDLKAAAYSLDLENDDEERNKDHVYRLIEDFPPVIMELHKQRTLHAESQQNAKIDELEKEIKDLKKMLNQVQARVDQVVPKEYL